MTTTQKYDYPKPGCYIDTSAQSAVLEVHEGLDYIVILRPGETTDEGMRVSDIDFAKSIVRACNSHEALVEALEGALFYLKDRAPVEYDKARSALTKEGR